MNTISISRILILTISVAGLAAVFLFQHLNVAAIIAPGSKPINQFFINRIVRFFLNDAFAIGVIYAIFPIKKYVIFSLYVQVAGVVLFLIPYFILKLYFPSYNGPMISYLHRLVLNPTLMLLLIPAFYYQQQQRLKR